MLFLVFFILSYQPKVLQQFKINESIEHFMHVVWHLVLLLFLQLNLTFLNYG